MHRDSRSKPVRAETPKSVSVHESGGAEGNRTKGQVMTPSPDHLRELLEKAPELAEAAALAIFNSLEGDTHTGGGWYFGSGRVNVSEVQKERFRKMARAAFSALPPSLLEAATERERIVEWLRNGARLYRAYKSNTGSEGPKIQADMCSSLADAISRGDHLAKAQDSAS